MRKKKRGIEREFERRKRDWDAWTGDERGFEITKEDCEKGGGR
jgi:hypothetical protein